MPHRLPRALRRVPGFTLLELLVTLAVAGVLMALAAPALQSFVSSRAVAAQASEFVSSLRFARGEAMKRTNPVSVCRLETPDATSCASSEGIWKYWMIFAERGGHGVFDASSVKIRVENAGAHSVAYQALNGVTYVSFQPTGIVLSDGQMPLRWEFDPTIPHGAENFRRDMRYVCLNAQGRAAVVDGTSDCKL